MWVSEWATTQYSSVISILVPVWASSRTSLHGGPWQRYVSQVNPCLAGARVIVFVMDSKANQNIIHFPNVLFHTLKLRILPVRIVDNNTSQLSFFFFFYIFIMNSLSKKMCHDEYWIHFGQRWKETISCCSGTFWQCANPQEVFCDFFRGQIF